MSNRKQIRFYTADLDAATHGRLRRGAKRDKRTLRQQVAHLLTEALAEKGVSK